MSRIRTTLYLDPVNYEWLVALTRKEKDAGRRQTTMSDTVNVTMSASRTQGGKDARRTNTKSKAG